MLSDAELNEIKDGLLRETAFVSHQTMEDVFTQAALANQLQAQLAKARSDALEEAAEICQSVAIEFGGYDPEGPSSLEAAHKLEGALACRSEILAKEKK